MYRYFASSLKDRKINSQKHDTSMSSTSITPAGSLAALSNTS
jgi:hypothetical protein